MMIAEPRQDKAAAGLEGGYAFPLRELPQFLMRQVWVIILVAILFTGAAVGFSLVQTPRYEASIMILVGQERGITETPNDVMGLQQLTQTMTEAVNTRPVAEEVIQRLDLGTTPENLLVEKNLTVEQVGATQFIEVDYRDSSPERAQQIANTIGEVFSERISEVSPSASAVTATVWERAALPEEPVSPNLSLNLGAGLALGIMFGVGLAFLLEFLDDRWRSPEEAEQISGVPTFGVIPEFEVSRGPKEKKGRGS